MGNEARLEHSEVARRALPGSPLRPHLIPALAAPPKKHPSQDLAQWWASPSFTVAANLQTDARAIAPSGEGTGDTGAGLSTPETGHPPRGVALESQGDTRVGVGCGEGQEVPGALLQELAGHTAWPDPLPFPRSSRPAEQASRTELRAMPVSQDGPAPQEQM